jgi:hypothetical protein
LHLHRGNGDAGDRGLILPGQEETAAAETATNIENMRSGLYIGSKKKISRPSRPGPIPVMQVLSPEGTIVRADHIVVFDDFKLIV